MVNIYTHYGISPSAGFDCVPVIFTFMVSFTMISVMLRPTLFSVTLRGEFTQYL